MPGGRGENRTMSHKSVVEKIAEALRLVKPVLEPTEPTLAAEQRVMYPPREEWHDWKEFDPQAWPRKVERHYHLIPTTCFNCESACGLLTYVDKATGTIRKF